MQALDADSLEIKAKKRQLAPSHPPNRHKNRHKFTSTCACRRATIEGTEEVPHAAESRVDLGARAPPLAEGLQGQDLHDLVPEARPARGRVERAGKLPDGERVVGEEAGRDRRLAPRAADAGPLPRLR